MTGPPGIAEVLTEAEEATLRAELGGEWIVSGAPRIRALTLKALDELHRQRESVSALLPRDEDAACSECCQENDLEYKAGCPICGKDFL